MLFVAVEMERRIRRPRMDGSLVETTIFLFRYISIPWNSGFRPRPCRVSVVVVVGEWREWRVESGEREREREREIEKETERTTYRNSRNRIVIPLLTLEIPHIHRILQGRRMKILRYLFVLKKKVLQSELQ